MRRARSAASSGIPRRQLYGAEDGDGARTRDASRSWSWSAACNMDLITYAARLPDDGETVMGRDYQIGLRGQGRQPGRGGRALRGARGRWSRRSARTTTGTAYLANFEREGISDRPRRARPRAVGRRARSGSTTPGHNRIIVVPGANDHVVGGPGRSAWSSTHRPAVVVGQHEIPQAVTAAAFRAARARGRDDDPQPGAGGADPSRSS